MTPAFISLLLFAVLGGAIRAGAQEDLAEDLARAQRWYEQGQYYKAERLLEEILEDEDAPPARARVLLLRVEAASGRLERADRLQEALLPAADDALEVALAVADYAFRRGRLEEAERLARAVARRWPERLEALVPLARWLAYRGRRDEVTEFVSAAVTGLDLERLSSDELLAAGRLLRAARDWDAAARCLVIAEKRRRDEGRPTTDVLVELGDLYRLAKSLDGEVPRAFATYRDALEQNASLADAKVGRALVHLYVNDFADAEKEVSEALAVNPNHVGALAVQAWFRVLDGRHSEALELTGKALDVNPASKRSLAVRAAALYLLDRGGEYEKTVARALEIDPTYGEIYHVVGDAISRHYRFAEAIPFHRKALEIDPELGEAWISLGRDLCFVGDEEKGREALERSYDVFPYPHPWRHNMELVLEKIRREFVERDDDRFRLRIHADENPVLGAPLLAALDVDLGRLEEKYGYRPKRRVLVEMMARHADFSVRTVGFAGLGAVGACFGDFVTLLSPRSELRRGFCWRRTVLHELTHVVTLGRSRGRVPRWLTEGLSVFEERNARAAWARDQELDILQAYENEELLKLEEFNSAFRTARIGFAYYQGGLMCEFFRDRDGFDSILALLDAYADDLETPEAVERVFGVPPGKLDEEFREWVRQRFVEGTRVQVRISDRKRAELLRRLRKEPDDVDLLARLAWATYQAGRTVDADAYLGRALKLDPDHPVALRLAALRSLERKRPDLAREQLERVFAHGGEEYFAALQLASLRLSDGDREGAKEAYRLAIDCFPAGVGRGNPYLALRKLLAEDGDEEGSLEMLRRYVERAETDVNARVELAEALAKRGEGADAERFLLEAIEVDPFVRDLYVRLGRVRRSLGRPAAAIEALRTALLVDPRLEPGYTPAPSGGEPDDAKERATLLVEIADIEAEAGDVEAARADIDRARSLWRDVPLPDRLRESAGAQDRPPAGPGEKESG